MSNSQQKAERLKALVSNPHLWANVKQYLDELIAYQHKVLEQAENNIVLHRAQGYIHALQKIKALENLNKRD
jgi:hypothetical protein